jgi:hypothetical protein
MTARETMPPARTPGDRPRRRRPLPPEGSRELLEVAHLEIGSHT